MKEDMVRALVFMNCMIMYAAMTFVNCLAIYTLVMLLDKIYTRKPQQKE